MCLYAYVWLWSWYEATSQTVLELFQKVSKFPLFFRYIIVVVVVWTLTSSIDSINTHRVCGFEEFNIIEYGIHSLSLAYMTKWQVKMDERWKKNCSTKDEWTYLGDNKIDNVGNQRNRKKEKRCGNRDMLHTHTQPL